MAVPLIVIDVLFTPVPTVNCKFAGAEAVMVTAPGALQVAFPRLLMDTRLMLDDCHVRPSLTPSMRV